LGKRYNLKKGKGPNYVYIKNEKGDTIFEHKGKWDYWGGSTSQGYLKETGEYFITVIFFQDSLNKTILNEQFSVVGDEEKIDLTILLERSNQITINKHYGNILNVELKRLWDPQKQFTRPDTTLLPDYEIKNTTDSTLYGIYHRFSSSASISWVQLHYIGFMAFQKNENGEWWFMDCNAPRYQMELKPGATGATLKDMKLDCGISHFQKGGRYRVLVEYGVNNTTVRENLTKDSIRYYYIEPHIYTIYDEFTLQ